jgi:hypothetical protein
MDLFIVSASVDYEGPVEAFVFTDRGAAEEKYHAMVDEMKSGALWAHDVALTGPFASGESIMYGPAKTLMSSVR